MPRRPRGATGGFAYHVLNRRIGRAALFISDADYFAFEKVMAEAVAFQPMRLLAYCLMPNHWHLVLWPAGDGDLSNYMRWLTVTHTKRYQAAHGIEGEGPLYQGRFKSFPVQDDMHFLRVCRYVERNALSGRLVRRAQDWRWGSLWRREHDGPPIAGLESDWPRPRPQGWLDRVNEAGEARETDRIRKCVLRGRPYGDSGWQLRTAALLGLEATLRDPGRPRKKGSGVVFSDPNSKT